MVGENVAHIQNTHLFSGTTGLAQLPEYGTCGLPQSFAAIQDQAEFCRPVENAGLELYRAHIVDYAFEPHTHEAFGLGAIEAGAERFRYAGSEHLAPAGALVMMNPDQLHTGCAATEAGWRYRMIYLAPALVDELSGLNAWHFERAVVQDPLRAQRIAEILDQLWQVQEALSWQSLVFELLQQFQPYAKFGANSPAISLPRFTPVLDYLHSNMAERLSLSELAALVDLSPSYFLRSFQKHYHVTPHQMLMAIRLFSAKQLLARGIAPVQVAAATGLSDQAHLNHAFVKRYGVTPARYQRQLALRK